MKKIISNLLIVSIAISMFFVTPVNAMTASELSGKLQTLKSQYPNGTHQTTFYNSTYGGSACYRDLSGHSSWECMAWARKVYDSLWGASVSNGQFHQNVANICIGDYVRYYAGSVDHSILVTNIIGDNIYYTDCNGAKINNVSSAGKIQWDRAPISKTDLQSKVNKKLNNSTSGWSYGHIVHYPNNNIKDLTTTQISIYANPRYKAGSDITITWDYTSDNADNWFVLFNQDGSVYKNYQNQNTNTSITLQNIPEGKYYAYVEWYSSSGVLCNSKSSVFEVTSGTKFNIQDEYYYKDVTIRWGYTVSTANYWLVIYDKQGNVCKRAPNLGATTYYTFDELPKGTYYAHVEWYEGDVFFAKDSEYFTVTDECITKKTINFDDSKYILFDTEMSWRAANDYCTSLGGTLVNINSSEENEAIHNLIQNGDREYYWIGCRDNVTEGNWYWTDNTDFWLGDATGSKVNNRYSNWDGIEPNASSAISDYGCIYKSSGKWDDTYFFFYDMGFVCEIKQTKHKVTFNANQGLLNDELVAQRAVDGVNTTRNTNYLIVYNDSGATTGTNMYGCEVLINSNHEVTAIINEIGNATVPHNGMILSGHGENQLWLSENVAVGDYVLFDEQNNNIEVYKKDSWYAKYKTCMQSNKYGYLPTPTRENYIFDGWYTSAVGGDKITADTIVTISNDHTLYAHWGPIEPHTSTTINNHLFTIKCSNIENGNLVILALYNDKKFVKLYKEIYQVEDIPFTVTEDYDEAKVMVWKDLNTLKPITDVEIVK